MEPNHFSSSIWKQIWTLVPPSLGALRESHTWLHVFEIKPAIMKGGLEAGNKDGMAWYVFLTMGAQ